MEKNETNHFFYLCADLSRQMQDSQFVKGLNLQKLRFIFWANKMSYTGGYSLLEVVGQPLPKWFCFTNNLLQTDPCTFERFFARKRERFTLSFR